jgi:hypothetical protein
LYVLKKTILINTANDFYEKLYKKKQKGSWKKFLENRKKPLENFTWLEFFNTDNWIPFIKHTCKLVGECFKKKNLGFYDKNKKLSYTHVYIITPLIIITSIKTLSVWHQYIYDSTIVFIIIITLLIYFLFTQSYFVYIFNLVKKHNFNINEPDLIFLITWVGIWLTIFIVFIVIKFITLGYLKTICTFLWHLFFSI